MYPVTSHRQDKRRMEHQVACYIQQGRTHPRHIPLDWWKREQVPAKTSYDWLQALNLKLGKSSNTRFSRLSFCRCPLFITSCMRGFCVAHFYEHSSISACCRKPTSILSFRPSYHQWRELPRNLIYNHRTSSNMKPSIDPNMKFPNKPINIPDG